jgi:dTDP-4-amino-4,6-dideoxygalactose transaminase
VSKKDTVEEYWDFEQVRELDRWAVQESIMQFQQSLAKYIGVRNLVLTPSGRWGLKWVLSAIAKIRGHSGRVVVPAFNCRVVGDAIRESGNYIDAYDFSSPAGEVRWEKVMAQLKRGEPPIALIVSHFFGVPVDFIEVISVCRELGVYVIEDCAHALGGGIQGASAGSLGDASVFSFNYDKPISLGWGGALAIVNENLLDVWDDIDYLIPTAEYELSALKWFAESIMRRRELIGIKTSFLKRLLRRLGVSGSAEFAMPNLAVGPVRACLGLRLLEQYDKILQIRNSNAQKIRDSSSGYLSWYVGETVQPAWLKQKVRISARNTTKVVCEDLQKRGYRVGNWNWPVLINGKNQHPNARETAEYWIDVPIHQNMEEREIEEVISRLNRDYSEA